MRARTSLMAFPLPAHAHPGITVPQEQGGLGMGYLHHAIAMEEISRASGAREAHPGPK